MMIFQAEQKQGVMLSNKQGMSSNGVSIRRQKDIVSSAIA